MLLAYIARTAGAGRTGGRRGSREHGILPNLLAGIPRRADHRRDRRLSRISPAPAACAAERQRAAAAAHGAATRRSPAKAGVSRTRPRRRRATSPAISLRTKVHEELPGASGPPDDLLKLKGVGPKLAAMLNERGITRFDQIAKLSAGPGRSARCFAGRVPRPLRARPDRRAGRLSRPRRHRRLREQVRKALTGSGARALRSSLPLPTLRRLGRLTSSLSILRPSMSTTSNR